MLAIKHDELEIIYVTTQDIPELLCGFLNFLLLHLVHTSIVFHSQRKCPFFKINYKLQCVVHTSSPLLLVQQREQRASRDILGYDGKLAGVIQTCSHKLDDTGVIEAAKDGDLPAEHVHV